MAVLDVLIVGGGPIGIACGLEAKNKGLSYLIIEKGPIVNALYNYPANMQFFSSSDKLEINDIPFISNEAKPKRNEALEYYRRIVSSNKLHINLFEKVTYVTKERKYFQITTDKALHTAKNIVLATGFYDTPNKLNILGEALTKVSHYYDNPHFYANQDLAIVGASNSAIDAALECYRKGARVSLIIRGEEVGARVKYWVRPDVINRIKEGSIKAYFNSTIQEITSDSITIVSKEGGIQELKNNFVLALTGYQPNFEFLEKLGVTLSADVKRIPQYNPETMESNIKGLYLAGVVCGGMETHKWFIENSRIHAKLIVKAILDKR